MSPPPSDAAEVSATRPPAAESGEARYRALFNALDVGFCVIEMRWDDAGQPVTC